MQAISAIVRRNMLAVILLAGLATRIVLIPLFGGYGYDMNVLSNWSWHLQYTPLDLFYGYAESPDHLPGDLWFLWVAGKIFRLLGGSNFESGSFHFLIKLVPALADVAIAGLLYSLVRSFHTHRAGLMTAAFYLLNPATIFLTAIWGQWDAVSMALVLTGLWVVLRYSRWWLAAIPLLAWALVIKPPLAPIVGLILVIPVWQSLIRTGSMVRTFQRLLVPVVAAGLIAIGTVMMVIRPFAIGLPGMETTWQLTDRMNVALEMYPYRTLAAANVWMIGQGALDRRSDESNLIGELSLHTFGNVLLVVALGFVILLVALIVLQVRPLSPERAMVLAMLAASLSFFMLPTRVHERYLFPAVALSILLAGLNGLDRRSVTLAGVISGTYFCNLVIVYGGFRDAIPGSLGDFLYGPFLSAVTVVNIGVFLYVFFRLVDMWRFPSRTWSA